jgi:hypothetical protein
MPMLTKRCCQADRHRDVPETAALRHRHVTLRLRALYANLPFLQIYITPLEGHHLATPKASVPTQEHDQVRIRIQRSCGFDQPFVLVEIVEPC